MAGRDGNGVFTVTNPDFVSGTTISSSEMDANFSDIATAITQSIAVDGQSTITADIPMANNKITGLKAGTALTDALTLGQAQNEAYHWCGTMTGTANAGVLTPTPAITAYAVGQRFYWLSSANANTSTMTVAVSGLSAIAAQLNQTALSAGDHAADTIYEGLVDTPTTIQIKKFTTGGTVTPSSTDTFTNKTIDANGTGNSISNIDVADLANGTDGELITWDAAGAPATVATGSVGNVLTSGGAGVAPTMKAPAYPPGFVTGLRLSQNATDTDHDVDITAGYIASDDVIPVGITCAAMTKRSDATFTAGTGNGWLDTGAIAVSTAYYAYAIMKADLTQDYLLSTSASSPTMPTDYIYKALLNEGNPLYTDASANLINTFHGRYKSGAQTITSAGTLPLTHGLGVEPWFVQLILTNTTADQGYTAGEKIFVNFGANSSTTSINAEVKFTSTTITIGYGSNTQAFLYVDDDDRTYAPLANGSWTLEVRAEA